MLSSITSTVRRKVNITKLFSTITKLATINFSGAASPTARSIPAAQAVSSRSCPTCSSRTECQVRDLRMTESMPNIKKSSALQDTFGTQMVGIYVGPQWQHFRVHEKFLCQRWIGGEPSKTSKLAVTILALEEKYLTLSKEAYKTKGIREEHRKCIVADKGDRQMTTKGYELFKRWLRAAVIQKSHHHRLEYSEMRFWLGTSILTLPPAIDVDFSLSWKEGIGHGPLGIKPGDDVVFFSMAQFPLYSAKKRRRILSSVLGMHTCIRGWYNVWWSSRAALRREGIPA